MAIFSTVGVGVLGAVIGSFLNVCIDRIPLGESIANPPSHCPACNRPLRPFELIPVFSYLVLGGRCRTCGVRIPIRVWVVEILTGLLFVAAFLKFEFEVTFFFSLIQICFLIVIAGIDLEHQRVPNVLSYPAIGVSLLAIPFSPSHSWMEWIAGGAIGFISLLALAILAPGGMGMGDVKLAAFIGLAVGYPEILLALFLSFVIGGLIAGGLLAAGKLKRRDPIAFGPFLALGGILTMFYGTEIIHWWVMRT